eukprot:TRINITY_DN31096_c0_g1_i1.p1 TRINITY_DN31096_c0_g1~~TRINITY_DN31096_c0_g1_i1.p1  ORF type:complete len:131 (-),score=14.87 TRINITY_DN31096_c0_g1_i1:127-474(-)
MALSLSDLHSRLSAMETLLVDLHWMLVGQWRSQSWSPIDLAGTCEYAPDLSSPGLSQSTVLASHNGSPSKRRRLRTSNNRKRLWEASLFQKSGTQDRDAAALWEHMDAYGGDVVA